MVLVSIVLLLSQLILYHKVKFAKFLVLELLYFRHESAIKEKTRKSSHCELHKHEALTQHSWGSGGRC